MFGYLKEVYFTGFAIVFRRARAKQTSYKAGSAIGVITMLQWLFLNGLWECMEMILKKKIIFGPFAIGATIFVVFLINQYFLFICGYGIDFASRFENLDKRRKNILVVSNVLLALIIVTFFIFSTVAYRRFFNIH